MKRYVFIIGLWAACFALPNTVKAQWEFSYICGISDLYKQGGYPTKSACETAARAMKGQQCRGANIYGNKIIIASEADPCRGKDLPVPGSNNDGGFSDKFGNIDITGTNQGKAFQSNSPFEELPDAYKQKSLQDEILLKRDVGSVQYGGYIGKGVALTGDNDFDTKYANLYFKKPRIFEQPQLESISSQENAEDKYKKQMEEAKRELAECKNDLCRMMAEKKYNDAFNMLASMSQNKAEQTLSDLMRKEYEKKLEASNNKPEEKYDWGNVLIDYGELGLSVAAASIPKLATGAGAFLVTANISLWAELARVVNNPDEYIDWTGKHTRTYLGIEIDWYGPCKIATNVFTTITASLVGGKVASKVTNAMPISGIQINGIYRSNRATEVGKLMDKVDNTYNTIEAVQIGLRAADIPPNNKK